MSEPESVYRCADCGHGRHLLAWAGAAILGPLGADGELDRYDYVDDSGVYEDSIQCTEHPGAPVEKSVGGEWCRWWTCPSCGGSGRRRVGASVLTPEGYPCNAQKVPIGIRTGGTNGHEGWRPIRAEAVPA